MASSLASMLRTTPSYKLQGSIEAMTRFLQRNFYHFSSSVASVHGPVHKVTLKEAEAALRKMRPGKETAIDDVPASLWKSKSWCSVEWLGKLFKQVVAEKKVPDGWQKSSTVPIWKKKSRHCSNYRSIRLLSHSMKIFVRILDRRNREIVKLSDN
ncbi:unnamed protein product [Heligmosomoides polygyrus]|uniref:Tick transposon n=1 Tax=Heligmosomoides polygyrus TaxID=6339 RepID=A0A183FZQ1_HELPZ|nr:unnamed protein product [Heligmosomoides polygyrus]